MTQVSLEKKRKEKETEQLRADRVRKLLGKLSHQARDTAQIPESLLEHPRCSLANGVLKLCVILPLREEWDTFSSSMI